MYFHFNLLTYLNRFFYVDIKIAVTSALLVWAVIFFILKMNLFSDENS